MAYNLKDIISTISRGGDEIKNGIKNIKNFLSPKDIQEDESLPKEQARASRRMMNLMRFLLENKKYSNDEEGGFDEYDIASLYLPQTIKDEEFHSFSSDLKGASSSSQKLLQGHSQKDISNAKEFQSFMKKNTHGVLYCHNVYSYFKNMSDSSLAELLLSANTYAHDSSGDITLHFRGELEPFSSALSLYEKLLSSSKITYAMKDLQMSEKHRSSMKELYKIISYCFKIPLLPLNEANTKKEKEFISKNKKLWEEWKEKVENFFSPSKGRGKVVYFSFLKERMDSLSEEERVNFFHALNYGYALRINNKEFTKNLFDSEGEFFKSWEKVKEIYKNECTQVEKETSESHMETSQEAMKMEKAMTKNECKCVMALKTCLQWIKIPFPELYPSPQISKYTNNGELFKIPDISRVEKSSGKDDKDMDGEKSFQGIKAWVEKNFPIREGEYVYSHLVKRAFDKFNTNDWISFFRAVDYGLVRERAKDFPSILPSCKELWESVKIIYEKSAMEYEKESLSGEFSLSQEKISSLKNLAQYINTTFSLTGTLAIKGAALQEGIEYMAYRVLTLFHEVEGNEASMKEKYSQWVRNSLSGNNIWHLYKMFSAMSKKERGEFFSIISQGMGKVRRKMFLLSINKIFPNNESIINDNGEEVDTLNIILAKYIASLFNMALGCNIFIGEYESSEDDDDKDIAKRLRIRLKEKGNLSQNRNNYAMNDDTYHTVYEEGWIEKNKKWTLWVREKIAQKDIRNFNNEFSRLFETEQGECLLFLDKKLKQKGLQGIMDINLSHGGVFKRYLPSWFSFKELYNDDIKEKEKSDEEKRELKI